LQDLPPHFRRAGVVAHGQTWSRGPFTCESAETGLTCTNASGNRLVLSRDQVEAN